MVGTPSARRHVVPDAGFSLVELLVVMVVSIAVIGGATLLAGQMQMSYRTQQQAATAQQEARYVIQEIERYLRSAGNNPYRLETTPCPAAGTPVEAVRLDPDGDGQHDDVRVQMDANPTNGLVGGGATCDEGNEDITIYHNPGNNTVMVQDNVLGGAPRILTDSVVTGLQFTYRNPLRAITNNPLNVAFIETRVTVQSRMNDINLGAPVTYTLRSEVRVRNR